MATASNWGVGDPAAPQTPRATVELTGQLSNVREVDRTVVLTVSGKSLPVMAP